MLTLFSWLTNVATLGVIALMALASAAVPAYFSRRGDLAGGTLRTRIAPAVAGVALCGALALAILHFDVQPIGCGVDALIISA